MALQILSGETFDPVASLVVSMMAILVIVLVAWIVGGRQLRRYEEPDLTRQVPRYRYTYEGFDPDLAVRTREKRRRATTLHQAAARVATTPVEEPPALRVIGGSR